MRLLVLILIVLVLISIITQNAHRMCLMDICYLRENFKSKTVLFLKLVKKSSGSGQKGAVFTLLLVRVKKNAYTHGL